MTSAAWVLLPRLGSGSWGRHKSRLPGKVQTLGLHCALALCDVPFVVGTERNRCQLHLLISWQTRHCWPSNKSPLCGTPCLSAVTLVAADCSAPLVGAEGELRHSAAVETRLCVDALAVGSAASVSGQRAHQGLPAPWHAKCGCCEAARLGASWLQLGKRNRASTCGKCLFFRAYFCMCAELEAEQLHWVGTAAPLCSKPVYPLHLVPNSPYCAKLAYQIRPAT